MLIKMNYVGKSKNSSNFVGGGFPVCKLLFKNEMHKSPVVCIELKKTAPCHEFSIVERELPVHMSHDDT